jgi:hypothetical protein
MIGHALGERHLWPDYHEIDGFALRERKQCVGVGDADLREADRLSGETRATGGGENPRDEGALRDLPGECVLATARTDDEDVHD